MEDYDRARRAMAARLYAARRSRIASFLKRTKEFADAMQGVAAGQPTPSAAAARCTCGWAKGPHATLCGLYIDDDADPLAVTPADPVAVLERDLTLLEVAQK